MLKGFTMGTVLVCSISTIVEAPRDDADALDY